MALLTKARPHTRTLEKPAKVQKEIYKRGKGWKGRWGERRLTERESHGTNRLTWILRTPMSQQPGRGTTFVYRCRNDNRNTLWQSSMCSYRFVILCTEARKTPNGYSWRRLKVKEWSISHSHCWCMNDTLLLCVFPRIYKNGSSRISPFFETLAGQKIFTLVFDKKFWWKIASYNLKVYVIKDKAFEQWAISTHNWNINCNQSYVFWFVCKFQICLISCVLCICFQHLW